MRLSGHQVLITGGASGIGLALAREFARRDNRVTVCGRDQNKLDLVAKSSPEIGTIACDITTPEGLAVLEERFADPEKGVSILVNNAATGDAYCFARDRDAVEKFERELQTNLVAPARLIKCLLPALASHPEAAIVNMTSGFALCPSPAVPGY
ncbi:MAG: hypothetical protein C0616_11600 [Desulfuromonas sp.]|nr:MAG: hypothetical protein C0616_11600 [Desulfuromonas sp.]